MAPPRRSLTWSPPGQPIRAAAPGPNRDPGVASRTRATRGLACVVDGMAAEHVVLVYGDGGGVVVVAQHGRALIMCTDAVLLDLLSSASARDLMHACASGVVKPLM